MTTAKATVKKHPASKPARASQPTAESKAPATGKASAARPPAAASRTRKAAAALPNRVRQHREKADLSPKELAAKIGSDWTASTVRRIERGARQATPKQIARLADALAVPVADLGLTNEDGMPKAAVGKRTRKAIATKADVAAEVGAIVSA